MIDMLDLSTKRICVTGGGGFLGSFVVNELRRRGCRDIFIPRRNKYDLTTERGIKSMFEDAKPEVLFHLAAVVGGIGANRENPGLFFYENAIMGIQLIEAARRQGVEKTIVTGTICSYPKFAEVPFKEDALWDGYPEETNAPYGIAKKALLVQCQSYRQQYGMNAIFVMPVNLYGPGDNFDLNASHVIPGMIRKCLEAKKREEREVVFWGDGSPTREFIYVEDAAEGLVAAGAAYDSADPVNIGSGQEISISDLARLVAEVCDYDGKIVWDTTKPNGQPRRRLDVTRAEESFGFRAKTDLREGLRKTVEWYAAAAGAESVARA